MNLWHDKSYISPSAPEWVERGYAMYDVHSVRFQFVYTEEQKKANRRAHTAADEGQALVMAAEARNSVMNPLMDAIAQNFVCYQYEDRSRLTISSTLYSSSRPTPKSRPTRLPSSSSLI